MAPALRLLLAAAAAVASAAAEEAAAAAVSAGVAEVVCETQVAPLAADWLVKDDQMWPDCDQTWFLHSGSSRYMSVCAGNGTTNEEWSMIMATCTGNSETGISGMYTDEEGAWVECNYWSRASNSPRLDVEWFWFSREEAEPGTECPQTLEAARAVSSNSTDSWGIGSRLEPGTTTTTLECSIGSCPPLECACSSDSGDGGDGARRRAAVSISGAAPARRTAWAALSLGALLARGGGQP